MAGILSWSVYVPLWRLSFGAKEGERAVANYDEDSVTMAVEAGRNCIGGLDQNDIEALYIATTTSPYREKSISPTIAQALDLRQDLATADITGSIRCGSIAFKVAYDAVKAGSQKQVMVVAADMRVPPPGLPLERVLGDGAVAFVMGDKNTVVDVEDICSVSDEITDLWRSSDDTFIRSWEERFTIEAGYFRVVPKVVNTLLRRRSLTPKDITKLVLYAPDPRRHKQMAKKLGFADGQIQDPLFGSVGNTGAAFVLMQLVAALEDATPGETILVANYGNGADAILLRVKKGIDRARRNGKSITRQIQSKVTIGYDSYLQWRGIVEAQAGRRRPATPPPSASAWLREREHNIGLKGVKCKSCRLPQLPAQRVCAGCGTKDNFEEYKFSDKMGVIFTFAHDHATPALDFPRTLALVDFEGGGRMFAYVTDRDINEVEIGMRVEMTFRKLFTLEGMHNYYWKCRPIRVEKGGG